MSLSEKERIMGEEELLAYRRCRGWLLEMKDRGIGLDTLSLALGPPQVVLIDAMRDVWPERSALREMWLAIGEWIGRLSASDVARWAADVDLGEQSDGLTKAQAVIANGNSAALAKKMGEVREEMRALAELEAAQIERDPDGYAARLAESVKAPPMNARASEAELKDSGERRRTDILPNAPYKTTLEREIEG